MNRVKLTLICMVAFLFIPLRAVHQVYQGMHIEITVPEANEYVIEGCRITAEQFVKKGFQPLYITMRNESDEQITVLPYISGANPLTIAELAAPFLYPSTLYSLLQIGAGISISSLGLFIGRSELMFYGFKRLYVSLTKRHKVYKLSQLYNNKNVLLDMTRMLKLWGKFVTIGIFGGQYPPEFSRWLASFKPSRLARNLKKGGLVIAAASLITGFCCSILNSKRIKVISDPNLASRYSIAPGQSVETLLIMRAQEGAILGGEIFKFDAEDPYATFVVPLKDILPEIKPME